MFSDLFNSELFLNIASYVLSFSVLFIMSITTNFVLTPKLKRILSIFSFNIGMTVINVAFNYTPLFLEIGTKAHFLYGAKAVSITVFSLLYFLCLFKEKTGEKFKAFIIYQVVIAAADMFYGFFVAKAFQFDLSKTLYPDLWKIVIAYFEQMVIYFFAAIVFYLLMKKMILRLPTKVLVVFSLIIVLNCFMILCVCITTAGTQDVFMQSLLLISPTFLLILSFIMYKVMVQIGEGEVVKEKLYWVENVKGIELDYYNKLQEKTNEVRRIRHDFKDNLETAKLLIKENSDESIEKASEIISAMEKSINATKLPAYSENVVVNAIVGAKAEEAKRKGIIINAFIDVPKDLNIESIDLNCVFLNLLNNAIEATEKLTCEEKQILLKSKIKAGYLFVKTENQFTGISTDEKGDIVTTKTDKDNHGIGTSLIKEIAKKYDGDFTTEINGNMFIACVNLKNC